MQLISPLDMESSKTYQQVQEHYGSLARAKTSTAYSKNVATAFGYSDDELNSIPKDANLGLSCGNPLAIASLCNVSFFAIRSHMSN
jgi:arsenite methyltransferase